MIGLFKRAVNEKRRWFIVVCSLLLLGSAAWFSVYAYDDKPEPETARILLVFPYNMSYTQHYSLVNSFLDRLSVSGLSYQIHQLELDTLKNPNVKEWQPQIELFLPDIKKRRFDMIVSFGEGALELLRLNFKSIPEDVPIVFCGQSFFDRSILQEHRQLTGLIQPLEPIAGITMGRTLFPRTKHLLLLTNWTAEGARVRALVMHYLRAYPEIELLCPDNKKTSLEAMLAQALALPPDSLVLFHGWYNKNAVNFSSLQYLMSHIGNNPNAPLLVMHDAMLKYGTVGGVMTSGKDTGVAIADLVARVLNGARAAGIPVTVAPAAKKLNWKVLQDYHVRPGSIPSGSELIGKPANMWERHHEVIVPVLIFGAVIFLLLAALLHLYLWYRRMGQRVKRYAEQEAILNSWLEYVVLRDDDDHVIAKLLAALVRRLGAAHANILQIDQKRGVITPKHEWNTDRPLFVQDCLPEEKLDIKAPWYRAIIEHRVVQIPDLASEEGARIYGHLIRHVQTDRFRSTYAVGIWSCDQLWGYLPVTFDESKPSLDEFELKLLAAAAHVIEIVLERSRNLRKLKRGEYEKRLILNSIKIPILLFDNDMSLIRVNNAALAVTGKSEAEVLGSPCYQSFCGAICRPDDCPVLLTRKDGQMHMRSLRVKGRDYQLAAYPIFIDGQLTNILKTMIDVTEFNEAQAQLTDALEKARAADKAKSFFLATMSHELRTPLNAVIGFSELLQNSSRSAEEQKEYLEAINLAGNALLSLINDILDLSKVEAGQVAIVQEPTDIAALVQELLTVFQPKAKLQKLQLRLDIRTAMPVLELDSLRVRQILLNLIGNAVKFTTDGVVTVHLSFLPENKTSGTLMIEVEDTGIGVAQEAQERIFEPFAQQDAVRDTHTYKGTGLGLAISQRLAETMGGAISLQSEVDQGSVFSLCLEHVRIANSAAMTGPIKQVERHSGSIFADLDILLVDDVPMNLKVLSAMLRNLDAPSRVAHSGQEALDACRKQCPDIILTDLWMPDMNGAELAGILRAEPATANVKIIAVTADSSSSASFRMDHFDGILLKPVTQEKLWELLRGIL